MRCPLILIIGSSLEVSGGISTVIKNQCAMSGETYRYVHIPTYIQGKFMYQIIFFIQAFFKIIVYVLKKKPEIIHIHVSERGSFWRKACIIFTLKFYRGKVVLHHHGAEFIDFFNSLNSLGKILVKKTLLSVSVNFVLGDNLLRIMQKAITARAVYVTVHNGVLPAPRNMYRGSAKGILYMSCFEKRKGIWDLLQVMKELDPYLDKDIKCYLCGCGKGSAGVLSKIRENFLEERIVVLGWIGEREKNRIFQDIAIHVLPSYREGMPMSILETMAYGIPNIAGRAGAVSEIINDKVNGWIFSPGDTKRLKELIQFAMENKKVREIISVEAYETIRTKFSLEQQQRQFEKYYDWLLKAV